MATVSEQFVANARTAVVRDGEYLLVRRAEAEEHAAGGLASIGGTVEEASAEAVLEGTLEREVREEVGVETTDHRYVRSNAFVTDTGAPCVTVTFRSRYTGGEPRVREPEEVASVGWYTPDEALEHPDIRPWTEASLHAVETVCDDR
jgi:8-oxo-dGTP diphosphatase